MEFKYFKPIKKENSIVEFFDNAYVIPQDDFISFFKDNNGARPSLNECTLKNGKEKVINSFLSFNEEDKDNVYFAREIVEKVDSRLIPFAKEPSGDYYCLKGKKVVYYCLEDEDVIEVADSFEQFINSLHE